MVSNVDGHTWALCAVEEERPSKVLTLQNKEHIPITDSPVVVTQHNIPPQKFVLLSAKVEAQRKKIASQTLALQILSVIFFYLFFFFVHSGEPYIS